MVNKLAYALALGVVAASVTFSVAAQDEVTQAVPQAPQRAPVQLTDAQLDEITAGKAVVILNSAPISLFRNDPADHTVCINCQRTPPGTLTTPNGKVIVFH